MPLKLVEGKQEERKRAKKQCLVIGCTRTKEKKSPLCSKHAHEKKRGNNPYAYWYAVLRRNAKRRGKVFTISLEYFISFCREHNYLDTKGRKSGCMTIDRRIDELGYIEGNLQIMEHGANVRKRWTEYWSRQEQTWQEPPIDTSDIDAMWNKKAPETDEECPF